MPRTRPSRSLIEQIADLEDPAPKDFDPEANAEQLNGDGSSSSIGHDHDPIEAREHYVGVDKSKLRKPNGIDLGPRYKGSSVSRDALIVAESDDDPFGSQSEQEGTESSDHADPEEEDIGNQDPDDDEEVDSEEAFESGDDEKFDGYTFRGGRASRWNNETGANQDEGAVNSVPIGRNVELEDSGRCESDAAEEREPEEVSDVETEDEEGAGASDSDDIDIDDEPTEPEADDRAALRRMMAEEQKTVAASLSKAAKADVAKGRAIKQQHITFDALLNGRIKLQKALIATNTMDSSNIITSDHTKAISAAESAALNLWTNLSSLRSSLQPTKSKTRPLSPTEARTSTALWSEMQSQDSTSLPTRRTTLTKWSQKTNPAITLTRTNKFSQTPSQQPLTSVLDQHLSSSNLEKLVQKTHIPRSCAPIQRSAHTTSDANVYDDADFYTLLLRELVDQRMADSNTSTANGSINNLPKLPNQRDFKVRKVVDTKASKGRKMRYNVHEKLQNFMAPDDRGSWGERQRMELFESLLGRKVQLDEDENMESDSDGNIDGEMEGVEGVLRLFG